MQIILATIMPRINLFGHDSATAQSLYANSKKRINISIYGKERNTNKLNLSHHPETDLEFKELRK